MATNGKARSTLINGLNQAEYDKVSSLKSAKEIWDALEAYHEGSKGLRKVKLGQLMKELGAFGLQKGETIKEAQARFQLIVNNLGRLGKIIPQSELNMNILASVPFDFQSKVTALEAAHNIDTMDHLALFAELEQFERKMHSKKHDAPVEKMKNLALIVEKSKPESDEESDEDLALLSKKIQRMINKHSQLKREKGKDKAKYSSSRRPSKESKDQNCFECGKPSHFKKDCYKLKSKQPAVSKDKKKKSKALLTWSDDEEESASSDESGEELINLALVGMEDDNVRGLTDDGLVETDSEDDNSEVSSFKFDISNDNLVLEQLTMQEQDHIPNEEYNSLKAENSKLIEKNNYLKNMVQELMQKIDKFFDSKEPTQARMKELQEKLDQAEGFHKVLMRRNEVQKEEISQLKQEVEARDACLETFKLKESTKLHTSQTAPSTSQPAATTPVPTATTNQQAEKIKILETEVLKLRKGMGTFVQGEEGLKYMMKSIKVPLDKEGVGHNFNKKGNALKYEGRRGKPYKYAMPWKKCANCGGQGHLAQYCRVRPQRQYFHNRPEDKTAYWNRKVAYQNFNGPNRSYNRSYNRIYNRSYNRGYRTQQHPQRQYFQNRSKDKTAYWNKKTAYQNGPNRSYRTKQHTYPTVMCLAAKIKSTQWIIDSGCTRHMCGDKIQFKSLKLKRGGGVTIGDSKTLPILGKGKVGNDTASISNVRFVKGLKYNLLSVSQLHDDGHKVEFSKDKCVITVGTNQIPLVARRKGNIYILDFELQKTACCLAAVDADPTFWHRRLGHAHMDLLKKLSSKELVRGLPKLKYAKTEVCSACQLGKQIRSTHKAKNLVSTSQPLELLHLDLFGPEAYKSIGGKQYCLVVVDDYSRYSWTLFLRTKDCAFEEFEILIKLLENKLKTKLIGIRSDHGGEFQKDFIT
ncbi:uncharacterized protein LOC108194565 [Daucus carota subsp. sativus]|uniref:uncharacterized protein LOC108194565 n=1 Tax=Daucus carota subsp. sativus TaxID=79200 RepID=UPI0030826C90